MGTATVTGAGSIWSTGNVANGTIFVGYSGNGAVIIEAGALVSNSLGYLGYNSGSTGTATVTGAGSKWTNTGSLSVGSGGTGMLTIEAGAQVSNSSGYLGFNSGATGMAVITGAGSKWTNSSSLSVGNSGKGTLHVRDGGNVLGSSLTVKSASLLTIDAGYGSEIRVGGGTGVITNNGTVQILTGPGPVAGLQSVPIVAGTWSGSGAYQAVGGTWNTSTHAFTISQTLSSVSATPVIIDLAQQQRVLVEDATSGWAAGASFLAKTGTGKRFDFTATAIAGIDLTSLQALLPPGQTVVNGWNLTADGTGYLATDPIYLSLSVPSDLSRHDVEIWKLTGTTWAPFTADDLTTADGYASFTTTGLSTYALTAVPEPSTLLLLFLAAASLFTRSLPKKSS
jgi:T5SS/PEP-CTERM-associated repeat protein